MFSDFSGRMLKLILFCTLILKSSMGQYDIQCQKESSVYQNGQWIVYGSSSITSCYYDQNDCCVAAEFYVKQGSGKLFNYRMTENIFVLGVTQMRIKDCSSAIQEQVQRMLGQSIYIDCSTPNIIQQLTGNFRYAYQCCSDYRQQQCFVPVTDLTSGTLERKLPILFGIVTGFCFLFH